MLDFLRDTDEEYGEFMSSCVPVYNSSNKPAALVASDISTKEITRTIRQVIINEVLIVALIMLTAAFVYIRFLRRILIQPLMTITDTVNGMVHGSMIDVFKNKTYTDYEFTLERGGVLFVYTGGVPEATAVNDEQYGTDRLIDALCSGPLKERSPERLISAVSEDIARFVGSAPQFDDTTMLAIIRN